MTTQKYLEQVEKYNRMIKNKMDDVGKLHSMATSTTVRPKDVNIQKTSDKDKIGTVVVKIVEMEKEIDALIDKRSDIINQIDGIEDLKMYEVLTQKYVKNLPIDSISVEKINSTRQIRRLLKTAEIQFEKLYGHLYL